MDFQLRIWRWKVCYGMIQVAKSTIASHWQGFANNFQNQGVLCSNLDAECEAETTR